VSSQVSAGEQCLNRTEQVFRAFADGGIEVERRDASLVLKANGAAFEVTLYDEGEECLIAADRWHSHYDDPDQVAACAFWLFTPFYRLVQEYKGGLIVAVWVERYSLEGWEPMDPVYFLNPDYPPDWEIGPEEQYLRRYIQHRVLMPSRPYSETVPGVALNEEGLPPDVHLGIRTIVAEGPQSLAFASYGE
jgi:hypothetical protein